MGLMETSRLPVLIYKLIQKRFSLKTHISSKFKTST